MVTIKNNLSHDLLHATADLALQVRHIKKNIRTIEDVEKRIPDYSPMIRVKNITVWKEVLAVPWHLKLIEVFCWIYKRWPGQVIITSGYRTTGGIHNTNPLRAFDLRSREFIKPKDVEAEINLSWEYGKKNLDVCVYHQTVKCKKCGTKFEVDPDIGVVASTSCPNNCYSGPTGLKDFSAHFHVQIRDNTIKL